MASKKNYRFSLKLYFVLPADQVLGFGAVWVYEFFQTEGTMDELSSRSLSVPPLRSSSCLSLSLFLGNSAASCQP